MRAGSTRCFRWATGCCRGPILVSYAHGGMVASLRPPARAPDPSPPHCRVECAAALPPTSVAPNPSLSVPGPASLGALRQGQEDPASSPAGDGGASTRRSCLPLVGVRHYALSGPAAEAHVRRRRAAAGGGTGSLPRRGGALRPPLPSGSPGPSPRARSPGPDNAGPLSHRSSQLQATGTAPPCPVHLGPGSG